MTGRGRGTVKGDYIYRRDKVRSLCKQIYICNKKSTFFHNKILSSNPIILYYQPECKDSTNFKPVALFLTETRNGLGHRSII